ncbi:MAG: helix-turn-helix domain-containing protein [Pseudoflavonifractor sp.]
MYKYDTNAIKRARVGAGVTQEKLAEMSGYSVESIKAWENGNRTASIEVLDMLGICLSTPWVTGIYLREQSVGGALDNLIPSFNPGDGLSQATVRLLHRIYAFADSHKDRQLLSIAEDDTIDADERVQFDEIMGDLQDIVEAALALRYAKSGDT